MKNEKKIQSNEQKTLDKCKQTIATRYLHTYLFKYKFVYLLFLFACRRLGVKSGGASVYHKTNRETMVEIGDSIRGKDIYIIQTGTK